MGNLSGKLQLYLTKRHRTWWAIHEIPARLRPYFSGKVRFAESLKTPDERIARQRATPYSFEWMRELEVAERMIGKETIEGSADFWAERRGLADASALPYVEDQIREAFHDVAQANVGDYDPEIYPTHRAWLEAIASDPEANRGFEIAMGKRVATDSLISQYGDQMPGTARTKDQAKSTLNAFALAFPYIQDITRKGVQKWIEALSADGAAPKTVARKLSEARGFWKHLKSHELVPEDMAPFADLVTPKASPLTKKKERKPYTAAQAVDLLQRAINRRDDELADLIRLGMFTGARIESLCSLVLDRVTGGTITFVADKTQAGSRTIPVHPDLKPTIVRLKGTRTDGFLLPGLSADNKYEDRSPGIGKRFGRLKEKAGFGVDHDFHSFRSTVITLLENANVSENIAADIVGHEKPRITYGLYSGGATVEVMTKALKKLKYPGYIPS